MTQLSTTSISSCTLPQAHPHCKDRKQRRLCERILKGVHSMTNVRLKMWRETRINSVVSPLGRWCCFFRNWEGTLSSSIQLKPLIPILGPAQSATSDLWISEAQRMGGANIRIFWVGVLRKSMRFDYAHVGYQLVHSSISPVAFPHMSVFSSLYFCIPWIVLNSILSD